MERLKALRVDNTVAEMINQLKDCAAKNGMKMLRDDESRVIRTPACYHYPIAQNACQVCVFFTKKLHNVPLTLVNHGSMITFLLGSTF